MDGRYREFALLARAAGWHRLAEFFHERADALYLEARTVSLAIPPLGYGAFGPSLRKNPADETSGFRDNLDVDRYRELQDKEIYAYDNQLRADDGTVLATFSRHWAACAAMIRLHDPAFKSLAGTDDR